MEPIKTTIENLIPRELQADSFLTLMLTVCVCAIVLGLIGHFALGKRSRLNQAVSSAACILCIYLTAIVLFVSRLHFDKLLNILPMVRLEGNTLRLFTLSTASYGAIAGELLRLILLSFLMHAIDRLLPDGSNILSWYLYRAISIVAAMILELAVTYLVNTFLPEVFLAWAPAVLLGILILLVLLGILKVILGLFLTTVNPILGGLYTFFFSNKLGRHISTALLTTALLTVLVIVLEKSGYTMIMLSASSLAVYLPYVVILLLLWYVIGGLL